MPAGIWHPLAGVLPLQHATETAWGSHSSKLPAGQAMAEQLEAPPAPVEVEASALPGPPGHAVGRSSRGQATMMAAKVVGARMVTASRGLR
jgi:hypothetical protein